MHEIEQVGGLTRTVVPGGWIYHPREGTDVFVPDLGNERVKEVLKQWEAESSRPGDSQRKQAIFDVCFSIRSHL